jgi:hypothetical protein
MKEISRYKFNMPTWALSYIENGDPSSLNDEDIALVDNWQAQFLPECEENAAYPIFSVDTGKEGEEWEGHFSSSPAFGLACDVVKYIVLIVR